MSTILLTGGTGFIGREIAGLLVKRGDPVRVLTRSTAPSPLRGVEFIRGDLLDPAALSRALEGVNRVIHCAAEKRDPSRMPAVNIDATRALLRSAVEAGADTIVHLSSVGVIGRTERTVVDESAPCFPMNEYERTKFEAEELVRTAPAPLRTLILRPTNVFNEATLRPWLSKGLPNRLRLRVKGHERAHLVYVGDVAAAALFLLDRAGTLPSGASFIVSSDEEEGNTHAGVQAALARLVPDAPPPPRFCAPLALPYWIRRLRHGTTNRGDVIYSSAALRAAGFASPYGLALGLAIALSRLAPRTDAVP